MVTEKELLSAIVLVSEIILEHGTKYAPLLDRLEQELEAMRTRGDDVLTRARRHMAEARRQGNGGNSDA